MHVQNLAKIHDIVRNLRKWMLNNPKQTKLAHLQSHTTPPQYQCHNAKLKKTHTEILKLGPGNKALMDGWAGYKKLMLNNPKLDVVNIYAYAKFDQNPFILLNILTANKILTSFKGHNSVMNWRKWMLNNPKLDVVNVYAKFSQNPFILFWIYGAKKIFWRHSRAATLP